jgi:RNA polymerase sigma-70 factor (ECF subfamily)
MDGDRNVAEDVTQETFFHLFSKFHLYDDSYPFRNWLYQVASNIAKNYIRKHQGYELRLLKLKRKAK